MGNPRKETTYPLRLRASSYGLAVRIAEQYSMSLIDAVAAGMSAWELLTEEQRAEITGASHEAAVVGNDYDDDDPELDFSDDDPDFSVMR